MAKPLVRLAVVGLLAAAVHLPNPASAVTIWNWAFTADGSNFGSGTFTTDDVTPMAGVTYDILAISGTYTREGTSYNILGVSGYYGASNKFQWDGSSVSNILADYDGIAFDIPGGYSVNMWSAAYTPIRRITYTFSGGSTGESVLSSSLSPVSSPVPGPLPIAGAAAALAWSRRLRRRIQHVS